MSLASQFLIAVSGPQRGSRGTKIDTPMGDYSWLAKASV